MLAPKSRYLCCSGWSRIQPAVRGLAAKPPQENIMNVFDRRAKKLQKNRTAYLEDYKDFDYLKDEIGFRLADRISDVSRTFDVAAELGCGRGYVGRHVTPDMVRCLLQCDMADKVLEQSEQPEEVATHRVVVDEELLPFPPASLDLVLSCMSLHWVNDLPGCFKQIYGSLKPDGCFMGCMAGGDTLFELRVALQQAEMERQGGFAPRISPFTDVRDLGSLMSRAGFVMLTIDTDEIVVNFPSIFELMRDLKGMGESNCAWNRALTLKRGTLQAAGAIYREMYGQEDGSLPATFQLLYMIGWRPDPSQAKAAKRGSGEISLKDLHRLDDLSKELQDLKDEQSSSNNRDTDK